MCISWVTAFRYISPLMLKQTETHLVRDAHQAAPLLWQCHSDGRQLSSTELTHDQRPIHSLSLSLPLSPFLSLSLPLLTNRVKEKSGAVWEESCGGGGDARSCCRHILLVTTDSGRSGARIGLKLSVRVGRPQDLIENEEICLGESTCFNLIRQRHFSSALFSCVFLSTLLSWSANCVCLI